MAAHPADGRDAALRVLGAAGDEVVALRGGNLPPEAARGHILRLSNAIDRSLRRLLRDDERADMSVRLKALAPDELPVDGVLAELRRNEALPMDLAASIHELLELRRRLEQGASPTSDDSHRTLRVVDRLTQELRAPNAGTMRASPPPAAPAPHVEEFDEEELARPSAKRAAPRRGLLIGLAVLLVLVLAGVWYASSRGPDPMEQGIALFRSGEFEESAQYFWRAAESNPDDPTPHLYLARVHRRMNRMDLAADAIRQAQQIAPEDAAVHRETGFLLLDTGQPEVAVGRFRQAIELDRESSEGWVGLTRALRESGRGAEVEAALADAPAEVRALLNRPSAS